MKAICLSLLMTCIIIMLISCGPSLTSVKTFPVVTSSKSVSADKNHKTDQDSLLNNGLRFYHEGNYKAAAGVFHQAVKEFPADWRFYYYLGVTQYETKKYDSAVINLESSLNLAPDDRLTRSTIYLFLGESWERLEFPGRAMLNFHTALNLNPESEEARLALYRLNKDSSTK